MLGKSIISCANKTEDGEVDEDKVNIEWPEDVSAKAKIIRLNAQTMIGYVEAVSNSFITGISDVTEAYQAAIKVVTTPAESHTDYPQKSVPEKATTFSEHLRADQATAISKIQDGDFRNAHCSSMRLRYMSTFDVSEDNPRTMMLNRKKSIQ
ncbi:hypothetical protein Ahy_A10g046818 isoform C [Arachis hypogaea]|nr:hypothetical protein Ahy_A10g046818 isoform C [Arachis hypogaea]